MITKARRHVNTGEGFQVPLEVEGHFRRFDRGVSTFPLSREPAV